MPSTFRTLKGVPLLIRTLTRSHCTANSFRLTATRLVNPLTVPRSAEPIRHDLARSFEKLDMGPNDIPKEEKKKRNPRRKRGKKKGKIGVRATRVPKTDIPQLSSKLVGKFVGIGVNIPEFRVQHILDRHGNYLVSTNYRQQPSYFTGRKQMTAAIRRTVQKPNWVITADRARRKNNKGLEVNGYRVPNSERFFFFKKFKKTKPVGWSGTGYGWKDLGLEPQNIPIHVCAVLVDTKKTVITAFPVLDQNARNMYMDHGPPIDFDLKTSERSLDFSEDSQVSRIESDSDTLREGSQRETDSDTLRDGDVTPTLDGRKFSNEDIAKTPSAEEIASVPPDQD